MYLNNIFIYWSNIFSIICINIIFYLLLFFLFIFIILLIKFNNIKYLNQLKNYTHNKLFKNNLIVILLSMSGIPPFAGFCGKFLIILFIFNKINIIYLFVIILLNFSSMYFYIQNIRFSIKKNLLIKNYNNYFFSNKIDFFCNKLSYLFILNFISIMYIYDIYNIIYNIFIKIYI